ncbi:DUF6445 family protein [Thalassotalea euphylliae]|uniref:DUF6445 family protein n=1 Tax=Thalassotalea euphylliae TaxID=1655234 RepID=UPI00362939C7
MQIQLNPQLSFSALPIADTPYQVFIVDDFLQGFDQLTAYAESTAYFGKQGADGTLFPGVRDEMPAPYYRALTALLELLAEKAQHGAHFAHHTLAKSWLSKVTVGPKQLHPMQKMPHFDALGPENYAAVHYLKSNHLGGTSFYRYRDTQQMSFYHKDESTIRTMVARVNEEIEPNAGYIGKGNHLFERAFQVDAKPNRIILYPGNVLHSADITEQVSFDPKSPDNRTSVNSFFKVRSV